jgi:hypothetical protein
MKKLITALLVAAFLVATAPQTRPGIGPAMLVLFCAASAGVLIIWVYSAHDEAKRRCIVLEKSYYDGNWAPVCTNVMVVPSNLSKAFPAFSDRMTDDTALYRVREIPIPPSFIVTLNTNSTAQPFIYP